jgi:oxygen-independent coproporphyrinogen-3 oxidase
MSPANRQNFAQLGITAETLAAYDKRIPRYTSYPTAPVWTEDFQGPQWDAHLAAKAATTRDLSLYVHIPFCQKRCLFCACNVIATRHEGVADKYLDDVELEVRLARRHLHDDNRVIQLHLGGGTPNYLNDAEMGRLIGLLRSEFSFSGQIEQSIEVDPRIATREEIFRLHQRDGFNRISFGVQDFSDATQHAIGREQGRDASFNNVQAARDAGFRSVNIDLIYGLPKQTPERFARTVAEVIALQPDRLSLFNYAHLPERFMPQRRISADDLPSPADKLAMLQSSIEQLTRAGYRYIGMDHFALPDDELAIAQEEGTLQRNFQGYTTHGHCDLIGLGVSAISQIGDLYSQNDSDIANYQQSLGNGQLATRRGLHCNADDRLRRAVIQQLICHFELRFADIEQAHGVVFRDYFAALWPELEQLARDGLIALDEQGIEVRPAGRLLVRSLCMLFDRYLNDQVRQRFSRVI